MERLKKRSQKVCFILGIILIFELSALFYHSAIVEGVNKRADKLKRFAITSRDDATILPGDFYDRNGKLLVETKMVTKTETDKAGKKKEKTVKSTKYQDGKAYSQVIGYTGNHILNITAESAEGVIGSRNDYRLMAFLDEDYWKDNGLYSTVNIDGTKGQSVTLTLDHDLQLKVYKALTEQMSESNDRGSALVMDAKTGEILSMVAFPTYDFNELTAAKTAMVKTEKETNLEPGFPVTHKGSVTPGSIFKVFMAVALLDHNMEDFTVVDTPFVVNGWQCNNAYTAKGDTITYYEGIERSSNVFYAQAALALGRDRIKETAEKFMLFENKNNNEKDNFYLSLDFGNIKYNWDLDVSEDLLAQTGFGQGKTELSTVYAAMITQAIANDGIMMKPYLVQALTDAEGRKVYTGKPKKLSEATSKSTANKVTKAMLAAAKFNTTHHRQINGISPIYEKYQIAGKTGTAETGDANNSLNAWFISFAPADDPKYVVVVNQCKTNKGGYKMMTTAADIYQYLFEER